MKSTLPIGHPHKNARLPVPGLLLDAYPEQQESEKIRRLTCRSG